MARERAEARGELWDPSMGIEGDDEDMMEEMRLQMAGVNFEGPPAGPRAGAGAGRRNAFDAGRRGPQMGLRQPENGRGMDGAAATGGAAQPRTPQQGNRTPINGRGASNAPFTGGDAQFAARLAEQEEQLLSEQEQRLGNRGNAFGLGNHFHHNDQGPASHDDNGFGMNDGFDDFYDQERADFGMHPGFQGDPYGMPGRPRGWGMDPRMMQPCMMDMDEVEEMQLRQMLRRNAMRRMHGGGGGGGYGRRW